MEGGDYSIDKGLLMGDPWLSWLSHGFRARNGTEQSGVLFLVAVHGFVGSINGSLFILRLIGFG
jgi:hypothetical protein